MTYLTEVTQDQFEVGINQDNQSILQDWLSDQIDKLHQYFGISNSVSKVATILNNLYMKPSDKIPTYNINFIYYASKLDWENSILYHCYHQGLLNQIQNMYALVMTIDYHYWKCDCKHYHTRQVDKEALKSYFQKQDKAFFAGNAVAFQGKANTSLVALSAKSSPYNILSSASKKQFNPVWINLSSKLANNDKLISNKYKKYLKNNLCLYCNIKNYKLDSCFKKQTIVTSKGCSVLVVTDHPAAVTNSRTQCCSRERILYRVTQENLIENSIQKHLPYILNYDGLCYYFSSLP